MAGCVDPDVLTRLPEQQPPGSGEISGSTEPLVPPDWSRLTEIGCFALGDSAVIGALGVPLSATEVVRYDCHTVPDDSVARTVRAIREAAATAVGTAAVVEWGTWWLINVWQECSSGSDGTGEGWYEGDVWVLPEVEAGGCTTFYEYEWVPDDGDAGSPTDPPSSPPTGGGGGGGGGGDGGDQGGDVPPSQICPSSDPACWAVLTDPQGTLVRSIVAGEFADTNGITNLAAREVCRIAHHRLDQALATLGSSSPEIWAGTYDMADSPLQGPGHWMETQGRNGEGWRIHIDPRIFDSTTSSPNHHQWRRAFLALLLHEVYHLAPYSYTHPNADDRLEMPTDQRYALDPPFDVIHSLDPSRQCTKPY